MSQPDPQVEIEDHLYDLYIVDCQAHNIKPTIRDYIVWRQAEYPDYEEDYTNED